MAVGQSKEDIERDTKVMMTRMWDAVEKMMLLCRDMKMVPAEGVAAMILAADTTCRALGMDFEVLLASARAVISQRVRENERDATRRAN